MWFGSVEVASVPSWRVLFAICDSGKKVLQLRHFQVNIILHWQLQSDSISQRIREVQTNDHTRLRNTSYTAHHPRTHFQNRVLQWWSYICIAIWVWQWNTILDIINGRGCFLWVKQFTGYSEIIIKIPEKYFCVLTKINGLAWLLQGVSVSEGSAE